MAKRRGRKQRGKVASRSSHSSPCRGTRRRQSHPRSSSIGQSGNNNTSRNNNNNNNHVFGFASAVPVNLHHQRMVRHRNDGAVYGSRSSEGRHLVYREKLKGLVQLGLSTRSRLDDLIGAAEDLHTHFNSNMEWEPVFSTTIVDNNSSHSAQGRMTGSVAPADRESMSPGSVAVPAVQQQQQQQPGARYIVCPGGEHCRGPVVANAGCPPTFAVTAGAGTSMEVSKDSDNESVVARGGGGMWSMRDSRTSM